VFLHLLLVVAVVFGVNLLPVFGPPTWAVLVFFRFRYPEIPAPALILAGAVAAASGRLLLALAFRAFGTKLPAKRQESLQVFGHAIGESRGGLLASFALFAVAPLPSAQMFEAAGLARIRLGHLLAAFFLGRLVSYSIYVSTASAAHQKLSRVFSKGLLSPQAITTELIGVALVIAMVVIDWPSVIDKARGWWAARRGRPAPPPIRQGLTPRQAAPHARLRGTKPSRERNPGAEPLDQMGGDGGDHDAGDHLAVDARAGRAGQAGQLQGADSEDDRGGEEEREPGHVFVVEPAPQAADHPHGGAADPAKQGGDSEQPT
jgi:hypothetical protein